MDKMRNIIFICFALLIGATSSNAQAPAPMQTYSLSLEEAVSLAFQNNKDLQIASREIDVARAEVLGARSALLPHVSAGGGYTHTGSILDMGSSDGAKKDPGIYTGYVNDNNLTLGAEQTVYNGGANLTRQKEARTRLKIQEQSFRMRKCDLRYEVQRLYFGLLLAQESARIARDLLDLTRSHYENVKKKYDVGVVSRFDLLQSKVQVSKLEPEVIRSENATQSITAELKKVLGIKQQDEISLKDRMDYAFFDIQEEDFTRIALLNNPEMALQLLGIDVGQLSIQLARSSGLPQVNASINTTYHSNDVGDMMNSRHQNWDAGVGVTVPIFDGFFARSRVDAAKARYAQALIGKENMTDIIEVNVKQACLDLRKAESLINAQKESVAEAQESVRIAQVRYDNGEGTNLDVLDAQVSLSQVQRNHLEGIFDFLMARAYWQRLSGVENLPALSSSETATQQ